MLLIDVLWNVDAGLKEGACEMVVAGGAFTGSGSGSGSSSSSGWGGELDRNM